MIRTKPAMFNNIPQNIQNFFIRVILVACVSMSIKIAIQMKVGKEKVSLINIILSFIIGVGVAGLTGSMIVRTFSSDYVPVVIGLITISAEKIGTYFIYKFNVDGWLEDFISYLSRKGKK